jgi:hypothetical protein
MFKPHSCVLKFHFACINYTLRVKITPEHVEYDFRKCQKTLVCVENALCVQTYTLCVEIVPCVLKFHFACINYTAWVNPTRACRDHTRKCQYYTRVCENHTLRLKYYCAG